MSVPLHIVANLIPVAGQDCIQYRMIGVNSEDVITGPVVPPDFNANEERILFEEDTDDD